jgi:putative endopeptidase
VVKKSIGLVALISAALPALAQDSPLFSLPYTPALDVAAMDKSADPCANFYKYSCGTWNKTNPMPADQAVWNVYSKLTTENQRYLWGILEQASQPSESRTPLQRQVGDFFAACMDESSIEKAGNTPLKPALDQLATLKALNQIPVFLARQHLALGGGDMLFGYGSNQNFENSSEVISFASAGGLGLPDRDYYTKTDAKSEEKRKKYVEHVQKMLQLLGDQPAIAAAEAKNVLAIETEFAQASLTQVEKRDPYKLFHKLTLAQLQALTPSFSWADYFEVLGTPPSATINVTEPAFFQDLQKQFRKRPISEWRTYLRWHLIHEAAPFLSQPFVSANFDFYSHYLRGTPQQKPRWKRCVQYVDNNLGEALGQVFVSKTFTPETRKSAQAMTKEIEAAMQSEIEQLPWMGAATKAKALEKLHAIVNKIGYPEKWRDYSSIAVRRDDFEGNVVRAAAFEAKRQLFKIGKPVDRGEWGMTPPTVNAYYDPQMDDINFPAGVLQPPLFDPKMDDAPNYGNTGATIGHELTHGFDDEGRQFDAKGNLKDWWTKQDADEFTKRAECIASQYSQYTVVDDIKINGHLTLGEDTADLGGTLLAFIAWKHATKSQDLKPIEGFTPDQRFFIGVAQWACGDERPENKRANAITNPHSPDEYRINGVVSNMPQFANAFSCKVGQPMVRPSACKVW